MGRLQVFGGACPGRVIHPKGFEYLNSSSVFFPFCGSPCEHYHHAHHDQPPPAASAWPHDPGTSNRKLKQTYPFSKKFFLVILDRVTTMDKNRGVSLSLKEPNACLLLRKK